MDTQKPKSALDQLRELDAQRTLIQEQAVKELNTKRESLQLELDEVDRQLAELDGKPPTGRPGGKRRGRPKGSKMSEETKEKIRQAQLKKREAQM